LVNIKAANAMKKMWLVYNLEQTGIQASLTSFDILRNILIKFIDRSCFTYDERFAGRCKTGAKIFNSFNSL